MIIPLKAKDNDQEQGPSAGTPRGADAPMEVCDRAWDLVAGYSNITFQATGNSTNQPIVKSPFPPPPAEGAATLPPALEEMDALERLLDIRYHLANILPVLVNQATQEAIEKIDNHIGDLKRRPSAHISQELAADLWDAAQDAEIFLRKARFFSDHDNHVSVELADKLGELLKKKVPREGGFRSQMAG